MWSIQGERFSVPPHVIKPEEILKITHSLKDFEGSERLFSLTIFSPTAVPPVNPEEAC